MTLLNSGPGGRRFKSSLPDQYFQAHKQHFWISVYNAVGGIEGGQSHRAQYAGDRRRPTGGKPSASPTFRHSPNQPDRRPDQSATIPTGRQAIRRARLGKKREESLTIFQIHLGWDFPESLDVEVRTGKVKGKTAKRHTSAEFIAFLNQLLSQTRWAKEIHIVLDNLSAHKSQAV